MEQFTNNHMCIDQTISIVRQASNALEMLENHGIVHNDINPANLALVDNELRIFDFETATSEGAETNHGTKSYLSPEGCLGNPRTPKNDIWSLAKTVFAIYTKRNPSNKQFLHCWQAVIRHTAKQNFESARAEELIYLLTPMLKVNPLMRRRDGGSSMINRKCVAR